MSTQLLERDGLLGAARRLLERACGGAGGVLVFEGAAGVGKTSLLEAAAGEADGLLVSRARPMELERAFGFGVVRRLFEPLLDERERRRLLVGPGAAAARVLADAPEGERLPADVSHAVFYGLFWLLAMVAATAPVLLVVDDAQWADEQSLAWLAYVAPRLGELPVALLVAARAGPATPGLTNLLATEGAVVEPVPPLGPRAVQALVARAVGHDAGARVGEVALSASGGNPFLLRELLRAWRELGGEGEITTTPRLRRLILGRVARAGADAAAVAETVAVLGGAGVAVASAAAAAGLPAERVLEAAEALSREDVLRPGAALTFVHPLIREAVYESMDPLRRAHAHHRADVALAELAAGEDAVAAQLLLAVPTGDAWTTSVLRAAAQRAVVHGAPDAAAELLRRALAEPPPADARAEVLCELGEVEARANDPQAEATLRAALAASGGRRAGEVALALARLLIRFGRGLEAAEILRAARERVAREDPELALRLEAESFVAARAQAGGVVTPPQVPADDRPDLAGRTPGERLLLACLTFETTAGNGPAARIARLGERALAGGHLVREEGPEAVIVHFAIASLGYVDRYSAALGHLDAVMAEARRQGSITGYALARAWRADVLARTGALAEAEADALDALALAAEHEIATGDTLTVAISTQPAGGTASVVDGKLHYVPNDGFVGEDEFQDTANDGTSDSEPALVDVVVDTPPTCSNLHGTVQSGKSLPIPVTAIPCDDPDPGAQVLVNIDDEPHHGRIVINDTADVATYTPSPGFVGIDTILFSASDEFGLQSAQATGTITVTPVKVTTTTTTTRRDTTPPTVALLHPRQKIRSVRAHGVAVIAMSSEPGSLSVSVSVDKRTARRLKIRRNARGRVVIGRLTQSIATGQVTVHVKLSHTARKALKRARSVKLLITVVVTDAAGNATTHVLAATLRR